MQNGPCSGMMDYYVERLADEMAQNDPDIQARRAELKRQVAQAVSGATGGRQNRSSADKYPAPMPKVNPNPLGVQRRGK